MIQIKDIILNSEQIFGTTDGTAIAISVTPGYDYVEGHRTDNQTHVKVEAFSKKYHEKVRVKVKDMKTALTNELIAQQGGEVKVKFKGFSAKFYKTNSGEYALSCSAEAVEV